MTRCGEILFVGIFLIDFDHTTRLLQRGLLVPLIVHDFIIDMFYILFPPLFKLYRKS